MAYKIEHRVGIAAPPEVIWDILADIEGWEHWNPLYTKASGMIRIGGELVLTQALPGQKAEVIRPRIIDWVPLEQLHWANTAGGGMMKTLRYIEIEKLDEAACIFSNGEIFAGLLGPTVAKMMRQPLREGFASLNDAMKLKAETAYAAMPKPKKARKPASPAIPKMIRPVTPLKPLHKPGSQR
jgi:hypothetical protein